MKTLPQNLSAEKWILASVLLDNKIIHQVDLTPEMFYTPRNQLIFKAMLALKSSGDKIDLLTLVDKLKTCLDEIGGKSYLANLLNEIPSSSNWKEYSKIVKESHNRRQIISILTSEVGKLYQHNNIEEVINELKGKIATLTINNKFLIERNPNLANDWLEKYGTFTSPRSMTGMKSLDYAFGGFSGTELAIIIAPTNAGKTTLMLNWALNMAKHGKKVLFFSLEMGSKELMSKLVSIEGGLNAFDVYTEKQSREDISEVVATFRNFPLTIISRGAITSLDVISEAYTRKLLGEVDVVMVDYLQRLSDGGQDNEVIRLKRIAQNLKNFALESAIPVITPVQVDKASDKSGKIAVENVAWSKDIANEADIAFYLYEKERGVRKSANDLKEVDLHLSIVKSRHSRKYSDFVVDFNKETLKMSLVGDNIVQHQEIDEMFI